MPSRHHPAVIRASPYYTNLTIPREITSYALSSEVQLEEPLATAEETPISQATSPPSDCQTRFDRGMTSLQTTRQRISGVRAAWKPTLRSFGLLSLSLRHTPPVL